MSKWPYMFFIVGGNIGSSIAFLLSLDRKTQEAAMAIPPIALVSAIAFWVFIYKMWSALRSRPGYARTSPGKAVGLLFIPFYNLYWIFNIIPGWASDYNTAVESTEIEPVSRDKLIAFVVAMIINIPIVSWVLIAMGVNEIVNGVNRLESAAESAARPAGAEAQPRR